MGLISNPMTRTMMESESGSVHDCVNASEETVSDNDRASENAIGLKRAKMMKMRRTGRRHDEDAYGPDLGFGFDCGCGYYKCVNETLGRVNLKLISDLNS